MPMSGHSHLWYSIFLEGPLVNHLGLLTSAPAGLVYQLTSNIAYVQQERTEASLLGGGGGALQSSRFTDPINSIDKFPDLDFQYF